MIKKLIPAVSPSFWPEDDARTLATAQVIMKDKKRLTAAAKKAAQIAVAKGPRTVGKKSPTKPKARKRK